MRRICSIITLISLLLSLTVHAENKSTTTHELDLSGYGNFVRMLSDIGVEITELELDTGIKKGEYVKNLISFFGYSQTAASHSAIQGGYSGDISVAYALGWLNASEKAAFNPEAEITFGEAARMMINALGYSRKLTLTGNTDNNYYNEAAELGLADGITSGWDKPISYAQMLKLFYNALDENVMVVENNGFSEGDTMLAEVHNVEVLKGIITANMQTGIAGEAVGTDSIELDGVVYECTDENAGLYLGRSVYALMRDGIIIHVSVNSKLNEIIVIQNEDIEDFSSLRRLEYINSEDKIKDIEFEYPPTVIVNGSLMTISDVKELEDIIGDNGELEAIDNDGDGRYEILKITNYITYVADMINHNKGMIIDYHINKTVKLDPDFYKITVIKNGEVADFTDISAGDVIEISADRETVTDSVREIDFENSKYITVLVSDRCVGGIINRFDDETVSIDETEYEISGYFNTTVSKNSVEKLYAGMSGAFYIDHSGKLVYVDTATNVLDKYGFLIWGGYLFENDGVSMRIYTSDGLVEKYELAGRVKVDGEAYSTNEKFTELSQLFSGTGSNCKIKNQLVIYRLNADGKISYIDTAFMGENENEDTSLRMDVEFYGAGTPSSKLFTDGKYNSYGNVYTSGAYKNVSIKGNNEKVFVVSGFADKAAHDSMIITDAGGASSDFEITTSTYFGTGDYMFDDNNCIMFYNVGDDNTSGYMVYYNPLLSENSIPEVSESSNVAFYAGRGKTLNKDDDITDYIKVYLPGENEMKTLVCKSEEVMKTENIEVTDYDGGGELKRGDIIRYQLAANGEIAAIKRDVDFASMYNSVKNGNEPTCFDAPSGIGSPTNYETLVRWLGTKSTSYFTLMSRKTNWEKLDIGGAAKNPMYRAAFKSPETVLIYDVKADEFICGSLQDLFSAYECDVNASVMYVRHTVSNASIILAYNFI